MDSPIHLSPRTTAHGRVWVASTDSHLGLEAEGDTPEAALAALRQAAKSWVAPARGHIPPGVGMKQAIILRRDLGMQRGKEVAQGAHASLGAVLPSLHDPRVQAWLSGPFAKTALVVDSEEQLLTLQDEARKAGVLRALITDSGRTQFHGVPTRTTLAIGPDRTDVIDALTGEHGPFGRLRLR